jgi:hypothetical protein
MESFRDVTHPPRLIFKQNAIIQFFQLVQLALLEAGSSNLTIMDDAHRSENQEKSISASCRKEGNPVHP